MFAENINIRAVSTDGKHQNVILRTQSMFALRKSCLYIFDDDVFRMCAFPNGLTAWDYGIKAGFVI